MVSASPRLLLTVTLALAGCGGLGHPPDEAGRAVALDSLGDSFHGSQWDADAVRAQAALDLACAAGIVVRGTSRADARQTLSTYGEAFQAAGCGQAITYLVVSTAGYSRHVPGHPGEEPWVTLRRFVPVSREGADAAFAALERDAAAIALEHRPVDRSLFDPWMELSRIAARELACPRESLTVDIIRNSRALSTYLAEGCGFRGLFVKDGAGAFVITSRVALTPGK